MENNVWLLANLSADQLRALQEAEQQLGPVSILAFQPEQAKVAQLNESQVECLKGLEGQLGLTLIAYQKP